MRRDSDTMTWVSCLVERDVVTHINVVSVLMDGFSVTDTIINELNNKTILEETARSRLCQC